VHVRNQDVLRSIVNVFRQALFVGKTVNAQIVKIMRDQ